MKALYLAAAGAVALAAAPVSAAANNFAYYQAKYNQSHVQSSPMLTASDEPEPAGGAAVLTRDHDGVAADLFLTGLNPNTYYSFWWIIFNDPRQCANDPCQAPADIVGGAGQSFNAGGFVTGDDGVANVSASLPAGPIPTGRDRASRSVPPIDPNTEIGLAYPKRAEVRLVVRAHGPVGQGDPVSQTTQFDGGCPGFPTFEGCMDQQFVVFDPIKRKHRRY